MSNYYCFSNKYVIFENEEPNVMDYDILKSVSQGGDGAQDAENSRIEAIADELRRRCELYEAQLGDSQSNVSPFEMEQRAPNRLQKNLNCGFRWKKYSIWVHLGHVEVRMTHTFQMTSFTK